MSENNPFRPITDTPPSPHRQSYILDGSPGGEGNEPTYADEDEAEPGYVAPSHNLHPLSASTSRGPTPNSTRGPVPNLDDMPPISQLPPGAAAPQRYYGALGGGGGTPGPYSGHFSNDSIASGSQLNFHPNDLNPHNPNDPNNADFAFASPRPRYAGYNDSDYDSVTRLRRDSVAGSMATFTSGGAETPRMSSVGTYPSFGQPYRDYDSTADSQGRAESSMYPMEDLQQAPDKRAVYIAPDQQKRKRIRLFTICSILLLIIIAAGVVVYFLVIRKHTSSKSATGSSSSSTSTAPSVPAQKIVVTGGNGSLLTFSDGTTATYTNNFGGSWYYDPNDPFNMNAQAQTYSPPLNTTFRFGVDRIYG